MTHRSSPVLSFFAATLSVSISVHHPDIVGLPFISLNPLTYVSMNPLLNRNGALRRLLYVGTSSLYNPPSWNRFVKSCSSMES